MPGRRSRVKNLAARERRRKAAANRSEAAEEQRLNRIGWRIIGFGIAVFSSLMAILYFSSY